MIVIYYAVIWDTCTITFAIFFRVSIYNSEFHFHFQYQLGSKNNIWNTTWCGSFWVTRNLCDVFKWRQCFAHDIFISHIVRFYILGPCDSFPCQNDGLCSENGESFSCQCSDDYQGRVCHGKTNGRTIVDSKSNKQHSNDDLCYCYYHAQSDFTAWLSSPIIIFLLQVLKLLNSFQSSSRNHVTHDHVATTEYVWIMERPSHASVRRVFLGTLVQVSNAKTVLLRLM